MTYLRLSIALILGASVAIAPAQSPKTQQPKSFKTSRGSIIDTRRFPATADIDLKSGRSIPENPELFDFKPKDAILNSLAVGPTLSDPRVIPGAHWPAIGFTGWVPPDPTLAVGPNHVVVTVNSQIAFYDKAGNQQFNQGAQTFFAGLGAGSFQFDPRVSYDRISGRWVIIFDEEDDNSATSKILLAVSDDNNPNGVWFRYRINANTGITTHWLDYPGLGVNNTGIVVCGNMFPFSGGGFAGVQYIWVDKAPLLSGGSATVYYFRDSNSGSVQVANIDNPAIAHMYGMEDWGTSNLRIHTVVPAGGVLIHNTALVAVPTLAYPVVNAPSSPGSLDILDGRFFQVGWRNGKLVATHPINGAGNINRVRWYEVNTNNFPAGTATLAQSGEAVPSGGPHFSQGGIAENSVGDIGMIFTRSATAGVGMPADAMAAGHKNTDPLGSTSAATLLQSSANTFYGGAGVNRWGDYFHVVVDPVDDLTFWGVAMTGDGSGNWRTTVHSWMISQLAIVPPASFSVIRGSLTSGVLGDLASSDDSRVVCGLGPINSQGSPITVEVNAVSPNQTAQTLSMTVELQVTGSNMGQTIEMWDWTTSQWVQIDSRPASTNTDLSVTVAGTNVNRFIQAGTRAIKAQVTTRFTGIFSSNYSLKLDQVIWKIIY
jgi:hypothetical protein